MTLTIYAAHVPIVGLGLLADSPHILYALLVIVSITFSVLWRRSRGQGPLERLVARVAGAAKTRVARRTAAARGTAQESGTAGTAD
jgi:hypothetical protein